MARPVDGTRPTAASNARGLFSESTALTGVPDDAEPMTSEPFGEDTDAYPVPTYVNVRI